jgi:hypothetical protein
MTQSKRDTARQVSVNWNGLKIFLGWEGTVDELKRARLDLPVPNVQKNEK